MKEYELCPECKKNDLVIKRGVRKVKKGLKQRYFCKRCRLRFDMKDDYNTHSKDSIVEVALDLTERGLPSRQIAGHIEKIYHQKISHATITNWVKKYR